MEKTHLPGPFRGLQTAVNNQFVASRSLVPHEKRLKQRSTSVHLHLVPQPETARIRQARNLTQWPRPNEVHQHLPPPTPVQPPTLGTAVTTEQTSIRQPTTTTYNLRRRH